MLHNLLLVAHVLIAIGLIGLVLIQQGKGADAGAAFGSGASGTMFGSRGAASFLTRTTGILATLFFITSLSLAYVASNKVKSNSVIDVVPTEKIQESDVPSAPEADVPAAAPKSNKDKPAAATKSDVPQSE
ncbi:MAG: preprotein translocase subunit SecG [Gammaproteobacteria bacterium]|nr:preprotein translocase subunit SecG [Gammaproteobacteria bacterium]